MAVRFNPPPGWPPSPEGWTPPPGWEPDPSWPAPPAGWQLWIEDGAPGAPGPDGDLGRFAQPGAAAVPVDATQVFSPVAPTPGTLPPSGTGWNAQPAPAPAPAWQAGAPGAPGMPGGIPPKAGKPWLIPVIAAVVVILIIVGILAATGVFGGSDDPKPNTTTTEKSTKPSTDKPSTDKPSGDPTETPTTDTPTEDPTTDKPDAGGLGARDTPLAPNTVANLGNWDVTLGASDLNAWAAVGPQMDKWDQEYYAPDDGEAWVMAPSNVTYTGPESDSLFGLTWSYISKSGLTYTDECTYSLPGGIDSSTELFTGASVNGNVCLKVPSGDVEGGVWRIDTYDAKYNKIQAFFATS